MSDEPETAAPVEDETLRRIRYLAPNVVTAISMLFGMVSLVASTSGHFAIAGWMIIYAVLSDRVDGFVARKLHATSAFGMQMDSFADFLNFGVAPSVLMYSYLSGRPDLPYHAYSVEHVLLMLACAAWTCCAVFRLARYNVISEDSAPTKIFFGVPTTMAGGMIVIWFLALLKYEPGQSFGGAKIFGDGPVPREVWLWSPVAMVVFAYLMVSSLPMPKGGSSSNKPAFYFVALNIAVGYVLGFAQLLPDVIMWMPTIWFVIFMVWGQISQSARGMSPPQLFPPPVRRAKS